jgi:hypothetical protein
MRGHALRGGWCPAGQRAGLVQVPVSSGEWGAPRTHDRSHVSYLHRGIAVGLIGHRGGGGKAGLERLHGLGCFGNGLWMGLPPCLGGASAIQPGPRTRVILTRACRPLPGWAVC